MRKFQSTNLNKNLLSNIRYIQLEPDLKFEPKNIVPQNHNGKLK